MTSENSILEHIHDLVTEEKALRSAHSGLALTDADRARLKELQGQLDQAWDLLRQRRAQQEFPTNSDNSTERPVAEVSKYLQ